MCKIFRKCYWELIDRGPGAHIVSHRLPADILSGDSYRCCIKLKKNRQPVYRGGKTRAIHMHM